MSRRLLAGVATAALTFGLVACGDGGDGPVTTPPPDIGIDAPSDGGGGDPSDGGGSASSDGGGDSAAAAPDIPAPDPADYPGMEQNTPEGAEQAFRYYIAVSMWSHQVGDDSLLLPLQTPNCESCHDLNAELPKLKESGRHWGPFDVVDIKIDAHEGEQFTYKVGYMFTIGEHTRPDFENGGQKEAPVIEYVTVGGMAYENGKWLVGGINAEWGPDAHQG